MRKNSLIRTIYLYLFSLLGLVLLIMGGVRFLDMGLKAFVFTKAEQEQRLIYKQPPLGAYSPERLQDVKGEESLSEQEKKQIENLITDYQEWKERRSQIDPVTSRRHRDASLNLAMILIGLPLYLYHWGTIKKEIRKRRNEN